MRWNLKYAIKSYISHSMWLVPLLALLFYFVFAQVIRSSKRGCCGPDGSTHRRLTSACPWRARGPCSRRWSR